jgi:hypothetical protein
VTHIAQPEDEPLILGGIPERGELEYDLDDWSHQGRTLLDRVLSASEIDHAWQGGVLMVRTRDEERVDLLVDEVQTTTLPTLDPAAERVIYEVAEWPDAAKYRLGDLLDGEGVAWEWDTMGDLVVAAHDEEQVDAVVDRIEVGEAADIIDDGRSAPDLLGDLFVAADRLRRNPRDPQAVTAAVEGARVLSRIGLPYGYEQAYWDRVVAGGAALASLLADATHEDDDAVIDASEAYRGLLKDHV